MAVFCDSEFWHSYAWENKKHEFNSRQDLWIPKIERNIHRDKKVNDALKKTSEWQFDFGAKRLKAMWSIERILLRKRW